VLVAEDDEPVRKLISRTLRKEGYTVLECAEAREAIAKARNSDPRLDMLITDVVMPSMTGVQLAEKLRKTLPSLPVLFVTGCSDRASLGTDAAGAEKVLTKPFTPENLVQAVRSALDEAVKAGSREG